MPGCVGHAIACMHGADVAASSDERHAGMLASGARTFSGDAPWPTMPCSHVKLLKRQGYYRLVAHGKQHGKWTTNEVSDKEHVEHVALLSQTMSVL